MRDMTDSRKSPILWVNNPRTLIAVRKLVTSGVLYTMIKNDDSGSDTGLHNLLEDYYYMGRK